MGKSYREYNKENIGESDIAFPILVGVKPEEGVVAQILHFGKDSDCDSYVVNEDCEIPDHYELVACYYHWVKIYDDYNLTAHIKADETKIFRAGSYGCIIQTFNRRES